LSIDMGKELGRKDWDGPSPALWAFDVQSKKATRLTPKKLFGWDGVWLDNDNILFLSRAAGEKEDSIYRMSTEGKNLKRLIKNARFPTVSAPNAWSNSLLRSFSASHFPRSLTPPSGKSHTIAVEGFSLPTRTVRIQRKLQRAPVLEISPDGTRVAFNTEGDAKNRPGPWASHRNRRRRQRGKVTVVPNIPSDNCFGAIWLPDGKQLAFSIMADNAWHLGLANADGSALSVVKNAELKAEAFGAPE
jgi:hypothetical protein